MNRPLRQRIAFLVALAFSAQTLAASPVTTFLYDAQGNLKEIQAPLGRTTRHDYDALNRPKQITDPLSGVTKYAYDGADQITSVTDPRNHSTTYTVDGLGNKNLEASPDRGATAQIFDDAGNLISRTDARAKTTIYKYDALNRLTKTTFADTKTIRYDYDEGANGLGRLTSIIFNGGNTAYTYDLYGHVASKTDTHTSGEAFTVTYAWNDSTGRLNTITYPSGKVINLSYDAAGRIQSMSVGGTVIASNIQYEPFGTPKSWTWGNSQTNTRTFDADGRMASFLAGPGETRNILYDNAGRIAEITHPTIPALTHSVGYDNLDRLTGWTEGTTSRAYTYDTNGNRESLTVGGTFYDYTNDPASNRINTAPGPIPARSFSYDNAGNTTGDGQVIYTYDDRGRMSQATKGSTTVKYTYDGIGQRVKKAGSGTSYYAYDEAGHLLGIYGSGGNPVQEYVYLGDMPIAILEGPPNNYVYYIYTDQLMRPWTVTDNLPQGQVRWKWDTSPFGELAPNQNPNTLGTFIFNLRFPGQHYDNETGLFYNYFRDYDPQTGRYVQSDPIGLGGSLNTYLYVDGNSVRYIDPLGLAPGDPFQSADDSALDAGAWARGQPQGWEQEYGGWIYKDGMCWTYNAQKGNSGGLDSKKMIDAKPANAAATWHTHPKVGDPSRENNFSGEPRPTGVGDRNWAVWTQRPIYLHTPAGDTKVFDPNTPGSSSERTLPLYAQPKKCDC